MPSFLQMLGLGFALGTAAGSALAAFFAVGKLCTYAANLARLRFEAKLMRAVGIARGAEGDDEPGQAEAFYQRQNWRDPQS